MNDPVERIEAITAPYLLHNVFILNELPERDRDLLLAAAPERYVRGAQLYRQGAFPRGAYWLQSGKVKIYQELPGGHRQTLYIYSEGDLMGYRQLITDEPYPIAAVALDDATVVFIPGETFRALLDQSTYFARNVLVALAREFSVWMNRLTVFAQLPVRRRLALALLILDRQFRQPGVEPGNIELTRTELAEYIGTSLETVVRTLHDFRAAGWIGGRGRTITVQAPLELVEVFVGSTG